MLEFWYRLYGLLLQYESGPKDLKILVECVGVNDDVCYTIICVRNSYVPTPYYFVKKVY
jgi:hypothetical protein